VLLTATDLEGPGDLAAYRTHALGRPEILFASRDGFSSAADTAVLPPAAHTPLNWAFTRAGTYRLTLEARLRTDGRTGRRLARGTFRFVVGEAGRGGSGADRTVAPEDGAPPAKPRAVLDAGHTDLTVDLDAGRLYAYAGGGGREQLVVAPEDALLVVPARAATTVPRDPRFAFLGRPGGRVLQLPQAVLGKHVHGEIDPHLWQDVGNAKAYALLIRDTLAETDPEHADEYRRRAAAYAHRLDALDREVRDTIAGIPRARRELVTTHDAFAYLADAYGLSVAGFVVPNPAQEPSARQVRELHATIDDLDVPAVFLEPNLQQRASVLRQVAADRGVQVCRLYGDAFDDRVRDYVAMMRHNARELRRCLGGAA
jgi:anchored repeat ABC transporter substrate-binding protein